jgi:hypothetical protein
MISTVARENINRTLYIASQCTLVSLTSPIRTAVHSYILSADPAVLRYCYCDFIMWSCPAACLYLFIPVNIKNRWSVYNQELISIYIIWEVTVVIRKKKHYQMEFDKNYVYKITVIIINNFYVCFRPCNRRVPKISKKTYFLGVVIELSKDYYGFKHSPDNPDHCVTNRLIIGTVFIESMYYTYICLHTSLYM